MSGVEGASDERLLAAHRALRDGGDTQFDLTPAPGPPPMPAWLKAFGKWLQETLRPVGHWLHEALTPVGRFLRWIIHLMPDAPYARIFVWGVIILLAAMILWIVQDRIRHGIWRLPRLSRRRFATPGTPATEDDAWRPEAAAARSWLQEADRLAAEGQFAQAVHSLLLRSVEDLTRRRPQIVRPAMTSRDLAHAYGIPPAPRHLFANIADVVERSLFGGRDVDADQWTRCRAAYADFVQARSWKT